MKAVEVRALWRVKDAADWIGQSVATVRELVEAGVLHRRYIGTGTRYYRVTAESIDAYVASLTSEAVQA